MRTRIVTLAVTVVCLVSTRLAVAGELMYGCCGRPACGKVCRLVCDTTTLTDVAYGCECKQICIPGPSRSGCKQCETRCGCDGAVQGCPPKFEFAWYDWLSCGCARPRSVRVLTKFQAEKKIPSYHWEVVDACGCAEGCGCVFKPAPDDAHVDDRLELTDDERVQVVSYLSQTKSPSHDSRGPAHIAEPSEHHVPVPLSADGSGSSFGSE